MKTTKLQPPEDDPIYEKGRDIVRTLQDEGYTACFAGGCVRDRLLGQRPEDYDIATDAPPDLVEDLFSHTLAVGKAFGVIIVVIDGVEYDVARFRKDRDYEDGRRPTGVEFSSAKEDVRRRDFTVNGLLWDPVDETVLDYVEGLRDLERGIIRTIGDPEERFTEDYLRMLRAPRFAAQLGFRIDEQTGDAICEHADHITEMAEERILDEFKKLISTPHPAMGIREMNRLRLLEHVVPEVQRLDRYSHTGSDEDGSILDHVIRTLSHWRDRREDDDLNLPSLNKEEQVYVGFSLLFHDVARPGSPEPERELSGLSSTSALRDKISTSLSSLRASNDLIQTVREVVVRHRKVLRADRFEQADWKRWLADDSWPLVKWVCRSILDDCPDVDAEPFEKLLSREEGWTGDELNPERLITGEDLKNLGLKPGPQFGTLLEDVRRAQLNGEISSRDEAIQLVRRRMKRDKDES